jgi:hypothetical protein
LIVDDGVGNDDRIAQMIRRFQYIDARLTMDLVSVFASGVISAESLDDAPRPRSPEPPADTYALPMYYGV